MNAPTPTLMDIDQHSEWPFPHSLPEFQRLFPDDTACAEYLEKARWGDSFVCPHCGVTGEPFRIATRPGMLECRKCRRQTGLTVGTVMERSHTPLSTWFWAAYLVTSQTPGMSAVQFQRQLGLSRYETAFQILHKLRAGMVRPDQDRIGGRLGEHVEVDEGYIGGRTRGKGRGVTDQVLVACAVEVRQRKPGTKLDKRKRGRYAGRVRLAIVPDRSADALCGFVESAVAAGTAATNISPSPSGAIPRWQKSICRSSTSSFPTSRPGWPASITASATSIFRPTSTSSLSASIGGSTHSMPFAPFSASPATSPNQPTPGFTRENGSTPDVAAMGENRIGKVRSSLTGGM